MEELDEMTIALYAVKIVKILWLSRITVNIEKMHKVDTIFHTGVGTYTIQY